MANMAITWWVAFNATHWYAVFYLIGSFLFMDIFLSYVKRVYDIPTRLPLDVNEVA